MNRIQKFLFAFRKNFYKAANYKERLTNSDFNVFEKTEFDKVKPEDIKDLTRLNYLKNIELSKNGYVNTSTKKLIKYYKLKNHYHNKNQYIIPAGNVKIFNGEKLDKQILFGYNTSKNNFVISHSNIDFVPIWKKANTKNIAQQLSKLYPDKDTNLIFTSNLFKEDIKYLKNHHQESVVTDLNDLIKTSFNINQNFKQGITPISSDFIKNNNNVGKNVSINFNDKIEYFTLKEMNHNYVTFQPLLNKGLSEDTIIMNKSEINSLIHKKNIELISKLDYNLNLGSQNGKMLIGQKDNNTITWKSYDNFIADKSINNDLKVYISDEIILNKNFLKEKNKISLSSNDIKGIIKEHYKTGKLFYGEANTNGDVNFKLINDKINNHIINTFKNDQNLAIYKNISSPQVKTSSNKQQTHSL